MVAILWSLIVLLLSLLPGSDLPTTNWIDDYHLDKLAHFLFYGIWAILLCRIFSSRRFLIFIVLAFLGILLEYVQGTYLSGRDFSVFDICFNLFGCVCGILFANTLWSQFFGHSEAAS